MRDVSKESVYFCNRFKQEERYVSICKESH